jgi:MFS family permease
MLRSGEAVERPEEGRSGTTRPRRSLSTMFLDIEHPRLILWFVITSAIISFGVGVVAPLMNVVFYEGHVHANEGEIGVMFAVAQMALAVAILGVPFLAARMLKVDGDLHNSGVVAPLRPCKLPFVLAIGLMPLAIGERSVLLFVVGASYVGRIAVGGVADPLDSAFNMEVLNAKEHATNTGLEIAAGGIMAAIAIVIGSRLIGLRRFHNAIPHHGNGASGVHGHLLVRVPASRTRQDRTLRTIPRRFRSRSHGRLSRALRATTKPSPRPNSHSRAPQPALKARAEPQSRSTGMITGTRSQGVMR